MKPTLTIHSGGANTSPSELKIPTLDFSNLPPTHLCYFTNASKEHSGTRLAIHPAIIDTIFEIPRNGFNYTGLYNNKDGISWIIAENFEDVMRTIAEKRK